MRIDKWLGLYAGFGVLFLGMLISATPDPSSGDGLFGVALFVVIVGAGGYGLYRLRKRVDRPPKS